MASDLPFIPDDFDVSVVGDDSSLATDLLEALREAVWRKCKAQPLWFLENFWSVIDPTTFEWTLFKLRDYQIEDGQWFLDSMEIDRARRLVLKARQIGWTTIGCGIAFHDAWFTHNHRWLIASKGEDDAEDALITRTKMPYRRLPQWLKDRGPDLLTDNKEEMQFDNGSWITAIPATGSSGRSRVVYGVLYDEAAFVDEAEEMYGALDQACYGPMFVFSTANGMGNWFHGRWIESNRADSEWESRFRAWHVVPGRGPFYHDEDGNLTSDWYERERRKNRGQMWLFHQENPATPEEAFSKTGRTVLNPTLLKEQMCFCQPSRLYDLMLDTEWENPHDDPDTYVHELWVWEEPFVLRDEHGRVVQEPNYVMSADVAEGLEHGDRTSIDVFNANTGEQVASYLGHWPVEDLGELLLRIARRYHIPLALVERNHQGVLPITDMQRAQYPRMWRMGPLASQKYSKTPRYGWNTNVSTKPKMIHELIRETTAGTLLLHDPRFLVEAQTFIHDGKGGMNASDGNHDDKVMSVAIGNQGVLHVEKYPIIWRDDSPPLTTMGDVVGISDRMKEPVDPLDTPIGGHQEKQRRRSFIL